MLTGAAGMDWFFAGKNDKVTDRHPFETLTTTDCLDNFTLNASTRRKSFFDWPVS